MRLFNYTRYAIATHGWKYGLYQGLIWSWFGPLKYGIQNLIAWFPVIWNDRDWDWRYWLQMNHKKLSRMEHKIRRDGCHVRAADDADNIKKAILAIERLLADDYHENAFKHHDEKYGELKMNFGEPDELGCVEALFSRSKVTAESMENYEHKASGRLHKHSDYMQKQDLEYATKIINKYLFHWWD